MQNIPHFLALPLFQPLIQKTQQLTQLNQCLHTIAVDLAAHCRVADIQGNCLILHVDNAAWATRLRYETPQLLKLLNPHPDFSNIEAIRWQIHRPLHQDKAFKSLSRPETSPAIKNILITTSQHIKSAKLKASLEKLASRMS